VGSWLAFYLRNLEIRKKYSAAGTLAGRDGYAALVLGGKVMLQHRAALLGIEERAFKPGGFRDHIEASPLR
jgi:hypothetical protein